MDALRTPEGDMPIKCFVWRRTSPRGFMSFVIATTGCIACWMSQPITWMRKAYFG